MTSNEKGGGIKFTDPPKVVRGAHDYEAIAAALRENPGEWALIQEGGPLGVATAIRTGGIPALRRGLGFELRTANNTRETPRTCDLYLRFNPKGID